MLQLNEFGIKNKNQYRIPFLSLATETKPLVDNFLNDKKRL